MPEPVDPTSEADRRAVFAALVESQDRGLNVRASRAAVARRFGISAAVVGRIELEGEAAGWPPL